MVRVTVRGRVTVMVRVMVRGRVTVTVRVMKKLEELKKEIKRELASIENWTGNSMDIQKATLKWVLEKIKEIENE